MSRPKPRSSWPMLKRCFQRQSAPLGLDEAVKVHEALRTARSFCWACSQQDGIAPNLVVHNGSSTLLALELKGG